MLFDRLVLFSQPSLFFYVCYNNGNLLTTDVMTNVFDSANRLTQSQRDQNIVQPMCNGLGDRVGQTVGVSTTYFALDVQGLPEVIYTSEGNVYLHLPGVTVAESSAGETRYLLSDGLGSVRQAVDDNGSVVVYNEFDPYGNPIVNLKSEIENPYSYTGEWWQDEVELLHLRARWYMPETGTLLSVDPVESEPPYLYVRGNPANLVDPSGLQPPGWYEDIVEQLLLTWLKSDILATAARLNIPELTNMNTEAFAAMIGAKFIQEDAHLTRDPAGRVASRFASLFPIPTIEWAESQNLPGYGTEISFGIGNIPLDLAGETLKLYNKLGQDAVIFRPYTYQLAQGDITNYDAWTGFIGTLAEELETSQGAIEFTGGAILFGAYQARTFNPPGQSEITLKQNYQCRVVYERPPNEVSAYIIASGAIHVGRAMSQDPSKYGKVYDPAQWSGFGAQGDWVNYIPRAADMMGLRNLDFLAYMSYEKEALSNTSDAGRIPEIDNVEKYGGRIGP